MLRASIVAMILLPCNVLLGQAPGTSPYQIHRDVIRGRATTDSGLVLVGADVSVTMAPDRTTQFAKTDTAGRYEVVFEKGTGDYLVHVAFVGRLAFRKRITRTGSDSMFVVDAVLKSAIPTLPPVQVQARRQRPSRDGGGLRGAGVGAAEQTAAIGVTSVVPVDQLGNLDLIASSIPGVNAVPGGGVSVLGLPPGQNSTTLNGLNFDGGSIPRGARTEMRVTTSTYDPARGGFSGAQTQVSLAPGNINTNRRASLTIDAPQLQAADAVARRSGVTYSAFDVNLGSDGATKMDRWMYNSGLEYKRQFSDVTSLADADVDLLRRSGVARDSVAQLFSTLRALGVPLSGSGIPTSRVTDYFGLVGRLDRPLFDYNTYTPNNTTWGLIGYANLTRRGAVNVLPTATAAHGGESKQLAAGGQWLYSAYFGKLKDQLTELRSGVSMTRASNEPYLRLPDGRVLLSSSFADGTGGIASLGFGGNPSLESSSNRLSWQTTSETQIYWKGLATHRGKLYAESRLDHFSQDPATNRLGVFAFNSLADLQANRPASFTRTLFTPTRTGGEWSGVLAASDQWAKTPQLSILYGARVEANAFTSAPPYNPEIDRLFGARTDHAPNTWHVSPRIGFNWLSTSTARTAANMMSFSNLGQFHSFARGVLRGGVGEFRQLLDPTLLGDASVNTGLPTGARRITCIGSAVPIPDWRAFENSENAIPTACVGTASPGFADAAPFVTLFDRHYAAARSWRGNLSWGSAIKGVAYTVDAIYSMNINQPSVVDLNFAGVQKFTLPDDGNRPVFVPLSNIVSTSGSVSTIGARQSSAFGSVLTRMSDLHGWARQLSVRARPGLGFVGGKWLVDGAYTYTQTRSQNRGFDGAAFGDPRGITWARGDYTPTHEITMQLGYLTRWVAGSIAGKLTSGLPYTPVTGSDVNGDGLANDRAFITAPGTGSDPALDKLIAATSDRARDCLQRQRGFVAARNSCEGPWFATLNAVLQPSTLLLRKLPGGNRTRVTLNLSNPLSGLDQLLHGDNLRGWGSPAFPDRVLYYVRGFDSTARRFQYEVNPRFGDTRPTATSLRVPFRATLDVTIDFSRNSEHQQLDRILNPGRNGNPGVKLDSAAILKRYCGNLPNWYNDVLGGTDSLLLTRDQVDAVRAAQAEYSKRIMRHWSVWAARLANLQETFNTSELVKEQSKVISDAWEIARQEAQTTLPKILSPLQLQLLGWNAGMLYRAKEPVMARYYGSGSC